MRSRSSSIARCSQTPARQRRNSDEDPPGGESTSEQEEEAAPATTTRKKQRRGRRRFPRHRLARKLLRITQIDNSARLTAMPRSGRTTTSRLLFRSGCLAGIRTPRRTRRARRVGMGCRSIPVFGPGVARIWIPARLPRDRDGRRRYRPSRDGRDRRISPFVLFVSFVVIPSDRRPSGETKREVILRPPLRRQRGVASDPWEKGPRMAKRTHG